MERSASSGDSESALTRVRPTLVLSYRRHLDLSDQGKIRLILASQSPRRREIMEMMGLQGCFESIHPPLDETELQRSLIGVPPIEYSRKLAEGKARALAEHIVLSKNGGSKVLDRGHRNVFVLGSDTIVLLDGLILEKPRDSADAKRMLVSLSGKQHQVLTAVALYKVKMRPTAQVTLYSSFVDSAVVQFADLTDDDIDDYIATREPMDKAGSYGIQGIGGQLVSRIEGDFFTVSVVFAGVAELNQSLTLHRRLWGFQ